MKRAWLVPLLFVVACKKKEAEPAPAPAPAQRPAAVTEEMATTYELYTAAFEKLSADIVAAGTDCAKAAAAAEHDLPAISALDARGDKLRASMAAVTDPAVRTYFGETYGPRIKQAVVSLGPLEKVCHDDPALKAAMSQAMEKFPMMRKKGG